MLGAMRLKIALTLVNITPNGLGMVSCGLKEITFKL